MDAKTENEILKKLLKNFIHSEKLVSLTFEAIRLDDTDMLNLLIDLGMNIQNHNFVFTALDNRAYKCLDLLIEKGASLTLGGRAFNGTNIIYVEPLELACINKQMELAKKLVACGAPIKTFAGVDVLRKYKQTLGDEGCDELKKIAEQYEKAHSEKNDKELDL